MMLSPMRWGSMVFRKEMLIKAVTGRIMLVRNCLMKLSMLYSTLTH